MRVTYLGTFLMDKTAQQDFLGRIQAHAFWHELKGIQKEASLKGFEKILKKKNINELSSMLKKSRLPKHLDINPKALSAISAMGIELGNKGADAGMSLTDLIKLQR